VVQGLRGLEPVERFWALRDVNFNVAPGKTVGIMGANGAGKSTLLRLIGGVGRPDEGQIHVHGRIGALLDLGAGFHPDLTGRENIYINGVISGLSRREVSRSFDSIVHFAELEDFIDSPLRVYSSGMQMRLGFSIAVHIEPEVLLIDEVLAVGDISFQQKCIQRIERFKSQGCTILLVSHEPGLIRKHCDEAIWLRAGRMVSYGKAAAVTRQYVRESKN
jgi:lipopolysaccharide transport system ATP-binding protein